MVWEVNVFVGYMGFWVVVICDEEVIVCLFLFWVIVYFLNSIEIIN